VGIGTPFYCGQSSGGAAGLASRDLFSAWSFALLGTHLVCTSNA
jgi:hypothetical protein